MHLDIEGLEGGGVLVKKEVLHEAVSWFRLEATYLCSGSSLSPRTPASSPPTEKPKSKENIYYKGA